MKMFPMCSLKILVVALSLSNGMFAQALSANAAAIHDAAKKGDVAALAAALDAGADIEEVAGGATPLFFATARGHVEAAKFLIARGADVNAMAKAGSPLMAAANRDTPEMVILLLAKGADPKADLKSKTALHVAAERGCLGCVKALAEAGADVNAQHRNTEVYGGQYIRMTTPLHLAILYEHEDVAGYLKAHGVIIPKQAPIAARLASADLGKGRELVENKCRHCHIVIREEGADSTVNKEGWGPSLWNIVGRDKASVDYKGYSKTMKAWEGAWTYEDLNTYLAGPAITTPGSYMEMDGVSNEADRVNVIAYLRTLSDDPVPLP
jgi:cytochrome c